MGHFSDELQFSKHQIVLAGEQRSGRNDDFNLIGALSQSEFRFERLRGRGGRSMRPTDGNSNAHAGPAQNSPRDDDLTREDAYGA